MITRKLFDSIFPTRGLNPQKYNLVRLRDELIDALNEFLPKYRINNALRVRAFLSVCGFETDYFKTSREYASGAAYEGRRDLGNVIAGDGTRFPGSTIIQTTGRYNFWRVVCRFVKKLSGKDFSKDDGQYRNFAEYLKSDDYKALLAEADRLGVNFLANPRKLTEPRLAVEAACIFWEENNLNSFADRKEIKQLNGVVNKGDKNKTALGWADRNELYSLCTRRIPNDFSFAPKPVPIVAPQLSDQNTQPVVPTPADEQGFDLPDLNLDVARAHLSDGVEMAKRPGVKAVLKVIGTKIFVYITTVWELGLSGKVALILGGILAVSSVGYVVYHYRNQIKSAFVKLKAAVVKAARKKTTNENS